MVNVRSIFLALSCSAFATELLKDEVADAEVPLALEDQDRPPILVPLRRESVPVKRFGKTVSFKTSYSGIVKMGTPANEYRVVFDTGSGHLILPDARCETDACLNGKKAYDMNRSSTGVPVNSKGLTVPPGRKRPSVSIGFGTGGVKAQFVQDTVCVSPQAAQHTEPEDSTHPPLFDEEGDHGDDAEIHEELTLNQHFGMEIIDRTIQTPETGCVSMRVLVAMEMSTNPFYYFNFDGILGLGMRNLAIQSEFSYFDVLSKSGQIDFPHFGVYLTDGEDPEDSAEIAFGGVNQLRVLENVSWNPVVKQEIGYWQVKIVAVRIGGQKLDVCDDGTCRGVVDTGTSHLGLPVPWHEQINDMLVQPADDYMDCRLRDGPAIEFELETTTLTLASWNYMRRLPIREGIQVGSKHGVSDASPQSQDNLANGTFLENASAVSATVSQGNTTEIDLNATNVTRFCRPRTMAVNLTAPVGPKFFILGEPILHKYYTVYDWEALRVGFALAKNKRNANPVKDPSDRGVLPDDVDLLFQKRRSMQIVEDDEDEEVDEESM